MYHLKLKGSKKSFQARNITGAVILISDKTDFKPRRDTTHSSKKKKSHQEDISILNMYVPDTRIPSLSKTYY